MRGIKPDEIVTFSYLLILDELVVEWRSILKSPIIYIFLFGALSIIFWNSSKNSAMFPLGGRYTTPIVMGSDVLPIVRNSVSRLHVVCDRHDQLLHLMNCVHTRPGDSSPFLFPRLCFLVVCCVVCDMIQILIYGVCVCFSKPNYREFISIAL